MPEAQPCILVQLTTDTATYRGRVRSDVFTSPSPWLEAQDVEQWDEEERGYFSLLPKDGDPTGSTRIHRDRIVSITPLAERAAATTSATRRWPPLLDELEAFFGQRLTDPRLLKDKIAKRELVNLDIAITAVIDEAQAGGDHDARILGYADDRFLAEAIGGCVTEGRSVKVGPPGWERHATALDEERDCLVSGIRLFRVGGQPVAVSVNATSIVSYRESATIEVLAEDVGAARQVLDAIREHMTAHNTYRGKVVALRSDGMETRIEFQRIATPPREDIVLPNDILDSIDRCVFGVPRHRSTLEKASHHLSRGLLFHGKPGTGKTLMVRHLIGRLTDHTVVLLTGASQGHLDEAIRLAKLLSPSVVVIEDADLIGRDRNDSSNASLLHDLMDHMDGLTPTTEVLFLLTTNQPEVIEAALASRPGRIDHTVEFPLPDAHHRRRLFELYARDATVDADVDSFVERTEGATGAFLRELLRRALVFACESDTATIHDMHLDSALRELMESGSDLTRKLLGYHQQ